MRKHQTHPQCRGWHRSAYWWQLHCIYLHWSSPPLWSPPEAQKNQIQPLDYNNNNNSSFISSLTVFISSHQGSQGHFLHMAGCFHLLRWLFQTNCDRAGYTFLQREKRHSARFPQKFNQWQLKTRWFSLKTNKRIIHKALQSHSQFNEISILHLLDQYTVRMLEHDWTNTSGLLLLINQENTQELWFVIRTIKTCHRHEYHSNLGLFMIS